MLEKSPTISAPKNGTHAAPADSTDRRSHKRAPIRRNVRFLTDDGVECAGSVVNMSAGGAMIRAKFPPAFGKNIVLYIDEIGRVEGKVVRSETNSFAVQYRQSREGKAKIADKLTRAVNRRRKNGEMRVSPRVAYDSTATVYLENGQALECAVLDISLTGASIEITPRPPLGMHLILGRMTAKVVRRHEDGVGVVFLGSAERSTDIAAGENAAPSSIMDGPNFARPFGKKNACS